MTRLFRTFAVLALLLPSLSLAGTLASGPVNLNGTPLDVSGATGLKSITYVNGTSSDSFKLVYSYDGTNYYTLATFSGASQTTTLTLPVKWIATIGASTLSGTLSATYVLDNGTTSITATNQAINLPNTGGAGTGFDLNTLAGLTSILTLSYENGNPGDYNQGIPADKLYMQASPDNSHWTTMLQIGGGGCELGSNAIVVQCYAAARYIRALYVTGSGQWPQPGGANQATMRLQMGDRVISAATSTSLTTDASGVIPVNITSPATGYSFVPVPSAATGASGFSGQLVSGSGGSASGSVNGGTGGTASLAASSGGNASGTHTGGQGGAAVVAAGQGGTGAAAAAAGTGGNVIITAGPAGAANGGSGATGGAVFIDATAGTGANSAGTVVLGNNSVTSNAANIEIVPKLQLDARLITLSGGNGLTLNSLAPATAVSFGAVGASSSGVSGKNLLLFGAFGTDGTVSADALAGGAITVTSGDGGLGAGAHNPGAPGVVSIHPGAAGSGGTGNANGASVFIDASSGSGTGANTNNHVMIATGGASLVQLGDASATPITVTTGTSATTITSTAATAGAGVRIGATRYSYNKSVAPVDIAAGATATVTQMLDGGIFTSTNAGATLTMPSAAGASGWVQNLPGTPAVGDQVQLFLFSNNVAPALVIAASGDATTSVFGLTDGSTDVHIVCRVTSITHNSETATCYW
jgi:hypothetical protein